jgi:hypothetical protein
MEFGELTITEMQVAPPIVTVAPDTKPDPKIVMCVPPDCGPLDGETLLTITPSAASDLDSKGGENANRAKIRANGNARICTRLVSRKNLPRNSANQPTFDKDPEFDLEMRIWKFFS